MTTNTDKNFCESGKHLYKEVDVMRSVLEKPSDAPTHLYIRVKCSKCDSMFLRLITQDLLP